MSLWLAIRRPPWRVLVPGCCLVVAFGLGFLLWSPGLDVQDGRHDRRANGVWLGHGWLGGDAWFVTNRKTNEIPRFRSPVRIRELAATLSKHHIRDVFPHLCPAAPDGSLPPVDAVQVERFLDAFQDFRVLPWVGGPYGSHARVQEEPWHHAFATSVRQLLTAHARLAGVQVNIEPLPNGDTNFLAFLEVLRASLPKGKLLSVAAYPPPSWWHPFEDVHWSEAYFRQVADRCDQLAVMMYDAAQRLPKTYQHLMAAWTQEVLSWSGQTPFLLGVPTYDDAGVDYHHPEVENLTNALLGIHRGLSRQPLPGHYQGIAIYCEWETDAVEWGYFRQHFLSPDAPFR